MLLVHTYVASSSIEGVGVNYADFIPGFELPEEWRDA